MDPLENAAHWYRLCLDMTLNSLPNTEKGKTLGSKSTDIHPF